MEQQKNNALEKVENIIKNNSNGSKTEEQMADERVKVARERAKRKLDKQKAQVVKRRNAQKQKQEKQQLKQAKAQEKLERKQMQKSHTEEERLKLKKLEKQAKIERKAQDRKEKARLKREKRQQKHQLALQKRKDKQKRKEQNRGRGGWLAAVVSLGITTVALACALTLTFLIPQEADISMETGYRRAFYDAVEQVDNMDLNLSKILVSKDQKSMQTYLVDLAINSELAENDLNQLPLQDQSRQYTAKLINQIGDYAKYINNKLINGEELTEEDRQNLQTLYEHNLQLKNVLQTILSTMGSDFSFSSMLEGGNGNLIINNFNNLQNLSVKYPQLIYDGPFSDGLDVTEPKGIFGASITSAEAQDAFEKIFSGYNLQSVKVVGETNSNIEMFNVQGEIDGEILYAQFSKVGGNLVMFAYPGTCKEVNYQDESAIESATAFLEELNFSNMKPVWINLASNVYTINFAYEENGVICYADLVKVRVCGQTNKVIGLEASSYYTNHTQRSIPTPSLSSSQAKQYVLDNMQVDTCRLAVVPTGARSEKLCYEFMGEIDGTTYYVYIDALNGRQVEVFKVIESTEGTLLM